MVLARDFRRALPPVLQTRSGLFGAASTVNTLRRGYPDRAFPALSASHCIHRVRISAVAAPRFTDMNRIRWPWISVSSANGWLLALRR